MKKLKEDLIQFIVQRNALLFGEFLLKSKRASPYFFNLAKLTNDGEGLWMVANAFTDILATAIGLSEFDYIHGPAYKGIPLAGAIALQLHRDYQANKRWGYDRKEAKDHGDKAEEWLVGELHDEDRVVIVDDVITTGLTKLQNLETLKQHSQKANLECIGIVILLDRQEQDTEGNDPVAVLKDNGIQVYSILEIRDVAVLLNEQNLISEDEYTHMQAYFERYGTHSKTL